MAVFGNDFRAQNASPMFQPSFENASFSTVLPASKNIKAEVRAFVYSDFDETTWWPEIEDDFGFWLDVYVGPVGSEGHEQFGVRVCTPAWLTRQHARDDVIVGWGTLLVNHYDPVDLQLTIRRFVAQWEASTWPELALRVARLGSRGPWVTRMTLRRGGRCQPPGHPGVQERSKLR